MTGPIPAILHKLYLFCSFIEAFYFLLAAENKIDSVCLCWPCLLGRVKWNKEPLLQFKSKAMLRCCCKGCAWMCHQSYSPCNKCHIYTNFMPCYFLPLFPTLLCTVSPLKFCTSPAVICDSLKFAKNLNVKGPKCSSILNCTVTLLSYLNFEQISWWHLKTILFLVLFRYSFRMLKTLNVSFNIALCVNYENEKALSPFKEQAYF